MLGQRATVDGFRESPAGVDVVESDVGDMADDGGDVRSPPPLESVWNEFVAEAMQVVASGRSDTVVIDLPGGADRGRQGAVDFVCVVGSSTSPASAAKVLVLRDAGDVLVLEASDAVSAARRASWRSIVGLPQVAIAAVVTLVAVGAWIVAVRRSAFMDEEISLVMGLRAWEGQLGTDGFRRWVTGSPISPVLSAGVAFLGGLTAARLLSALVVVAGCVVMAVAATTGMRGGGSGGEVEVARRAGVGLLTFAAAVCSAPVLVLATQVTHDALASFAMACAFGSAAIARVTSRRMWLAIAALWSGIAGVIAYAAFAMAIPLLLVAASRSFAADGPKASERLSRASRRPTDVVLAAMVFALAPTLMLSLYGADIDALRWFLAKEAPGLSLPRRELAVEFAWILAVPAALAVAGVVSRRRRARHGGVTSSSAIELLAFCTMPAAHLVSGVGQASLRHCAYGIIAAAPLLGEGARFLLGRWPRRLGPVLVAVMAVVGIGQARAVNRSWTDLGPALELLAAEAAPGDRVVTVHEWPVAGLLYREGVLSSPWDVTGPDRQRALNVAVDACAAQWYVEDLSRPGGIELRSQVERCGTFVEVLRYDQRVDAAPGSGDRGGTVTVSVWRNEGATR